MTKQPTLKRGLSRFGIREWKGITFNAGTLVPLFRKSMVPGDVFKDNIFFNFRSQTPFHQVFGDLYIDVYAFFVPERLVNSTAAEHYGQQYNSPAWRDPVARPPKNACAMRLLQGSNPRTVMQSSIYDYFDVPYGEYQGTDGSLRVSASPFRGYDMIWNEYFCNENWFSKIPQYTGPVSQAELDGWNGGLHAVCRRHDYFSTCLPLPQKGEPILIPGFDFSDFQGYLPGQIPIRGVDAYSLDLAHADPGAQVFWKAINGDLTPNNYAFVLDPDTTYNVARMAYGGPAGTAPVGSTGFAPVNLVADTRADNPDSQIGTQSRATLTALRDAFQRQRFLEASARGGTRLVETIYAHFGVQTSDARLDRPEYLGHFRESINQSQIIQTASTEDGDLGDVGAYSHTVDLKNGVIRYAAQEWGEIIVVGCVRKDSLYSQGVPRELLIIDAEDEYYPEFATMSEQPVYTQEIYAFADKNDVWGYQPPYEYMRRGVNRVVSQMRPSPDANFSSWTYAEYYNSRPYLSQGWLVDNSQDILNRTLRVQSTTGVHQFFGVIQVVSQKMRPMPLFGIPGLADHH